MQTAKKALVKLEENYFAQLSDGGIQTFLDKCKILARQFELEQSKKIQFLNVQKPSPSAEIDTAFIHQKGDPVWYKSWGGIRSYKYD